jgi:hypothetical protein
MPEELKIPPHRDLQAAGARTPVVMQPVPFEVCSH